LKKKITIIGGGAAGFFCAANLDENKFNVTILEQNQDVLQKVKISGGGRCNVSHACFDPKRIGEILSKRKQRIIECFQ
jgi:predicted flavoprotein YhiN